MRIIWRELVVDVSGRPSDTLLSAWRWMVPADLDLRMVSAFGNAFEAENFEVCKLSDHLAALGKIQTQVKPLPIGTRITSVGLA